LINFENVRIVITLSSMMYLASLKEHNVQVRQINTYIKIFL